MPYGNWTDLSTALEDPFDGSQIRYRVGRSGVNERGPWAVLFPFLDARDIRRRLNEVCGRENWEVEHYNAGKGIACRIRIRLAGGNDWVSKTDGADSTDIEATKGAFSEAFKRAAYAWGIGEFLYDMPTPFAECTTQKQSGDEWTYAKDRKTSTQFWWRLPAPQTEDYREAAKKKQAATKPPAGNPTPPPPPNERKPNPLRDSLLHEIQTLIIGKEYRQEEVEKLRKDCSYVDTARLIAIKKEIVAGTYFSPVDPDPNGNQVGAGDGDPDPETELDIF